MDEEELDIYCSLCLGEDDDIRYYENLGLLVCRECYLENEDD